MKNNLHYIATPSGRMSRPLRIAGIITTITVLIFLVSTWSSLAQGGYSVSWWTVDGGGGQSSGGPYLVKGTTGQADAGSAMNGGRYQVSGGFWSSADLAAGTRYLYLPVVLK
jgi:hypothetical protein